MGKCRKVKRVSQEFSFLAIQYLQDVLTTFAKKLIIQFNVLDLQEQLIATLSELFRSNMGDNTVTFEVMELEKIRERLRLPIQHR